MTTNLYEQAARERKVTALVAVLREAGCDAPTAAAMSDETKALALKTAGLKSASDETWALVVHSLDVAQVRFVPDDPFACFPR